MFLKENIGENLCELLFGETFLDTQKHGSWKKKTDKSDFTKIKNVCSTENTVKRVKRQISNWEKIFANNIPDKGLISKKYKELLKCNNKKTNSTN